MPPSCQCEAHEAIGRGRPPRHAEPLHRKALQQHHNALTSLMIFDMTYRRQAHLERCMRDAETLRAVARLARSRARLPTSHSGEYRQARLADRPLLIRFAVDLEATADFIEEAWARQAGGNS